MGSNIKKYFEYNKEEEIDADEIKCYFYEFIDDTCDLKYPIKLIFENGYVEINFDFYYQVWVNKDIDSIIERLKKSYKVTKRKGKTNMFTQKELPVVGTNRTSFVSDQILYIKLYIKALD